MPSMLRALKCSYSNCFKHNYYYYCQHYRLCQYYCYKDEEGGEEVEICADHVLGLLLHCSLFKKFF